METRRPYGNGTATSAFALRPYQAEAVEFGIEAIRQHKRGLIVIPTGGGKSCVIASILMWCVANGLRVLVLTHVAELVEQNHDELLELWPDAPAGMTCAGLNRFDLDNPIIFASIQTFDARLSKAGRFDVVLIDEAHMVPRDPDTRYHRVLDALERDHGGDLPVIGLTATPYRLDSGRLDEGPTRRFDEVLIDVPIMHLVNEGWLAPLVTIKPDVEIDASKVPMRGNEYVSRALQEASGGDELNQSIVADVVAKGANRKSWLVFTTGVGHAALVTDLLLDHDIRAACVLGDTPSDERRDHIERFKSGDIQALVNVDCLTTGFNARAVDLIAVLRSTQSPGLHVQMLGRGTRTADGKTNCLVLDYAGNIRRHGPLADVMAPKTQAGDRQRYDAESGLALKVCPMCQAYAATRALKCENCQAEFPVEETPHLTAVADTLDPLIHQQWHRVERVHYSRHDKIGKPSSLKVSYKLEGDLWRSEWICIGHDGWARRQAIQWWRERWPGGPIPNSADQALQMRNHLRVPTAIRLTRSGDFEKAGDARFNDLVGAA